MPQNTDSPYEICVYCKQHIQPGALFKRLEFGKAAHLACYADHLDDEEPPDEGDGGSTPDGSR